MSAIFAKPEPFLFSFVDGEQVLVVRVLENSHQAALTRFQGMSVAERRGQAVSRLVRRERDHLVALRDWFDRYLPRFSARDRNRA